MPINLVIPKIEEIPEPLRESRVAHELRVKTQEVVDCLNNFSQTLLELQQKCAHLNMMDIFINKFQGRDLFRKECPDCGIVINRPSGDVWEICALCWGKMILEYSLTSQQRQEHYYRCQDCGDSIFRS